MVQVLTVLNAFAGKLYDSKGNRRKWWSNSTLENFNRNSRCLVDQYSNFTFYGHQVLIERRLVYFVLTFL